MSLHIKKISFSLLLFILVSFISVSVFANEDSTQAEDDTGDELEWIETV